MIIGFFTNIFTIEYPILLPRAGRYLGILVIPWYGWNQTIRVAIDLVAKFQLLKLYYHFRYSVSQFYRDMKRF